MAEALKEALRPKIRGFSTVRIQKQPLLDVLTKNLETHKKDFKEAWTGYEKAFILEAEKILTLAKEKKQFNHYITLEIPHDYSDDYERVITMLQFSSDDEFEISTQEFDSYVRDEWSWKKQFVGTSSRYLAGK